MLGRREQAEFAEYQKLQSIRSYIASNRRHFRQGSIVDLDDVLSTFNLSEPDYTRLGSNEAISEYNAFCTQRTALTRRFNDILAERGLYVRKKPGINQWSVYRSNRAEAKVDRLHENGSNTTGDAERLHRGIAEYRSNYRHVHNDTLRTIAARRVGRYGK